MQYSPISDFKVNNKVFVKVQFFKTTQPLKKFSKKYLRSYKIIFQPGILSFTLCLPESIHSVHSVFHVSILESTMSNSFPKRIQLAPILVIIDRKSKYKISQIINSKIDCQQVYKLLYKMIWLGYKDTEDKLEWISTSGLTHTTNLVSDFYITYSTKSILLPLP